MKPLLVILSFLLLTSPLFGQETGVLYLWENGTKYMGEWKDGKKHGQGTFTFPSGFKYVGEFKDGKMWNVTKHNKDGKYVGEFKDGEIWNGIVYDKNGNFIGKWVNGVKQ